MKVQLLVSAALVLLSAVPGVFSEEPSSVVAKPIESFNSVFDAISDEVGDLYEDEEDFNMEQELWSSKSNKRSRRRSRGRNNSSGRRGRGGQGRGMCGSGMRSRDRSTCRSLRREFCNSRRDRRDNSSICRYMGFATSTEGAAGDAPETYADDTELFAEEDADKYDMIIEDIAEELERGEFDAEQELWSSKSNKRSRRRSRGRNNSSGRRGRGGQGRGMCGSGMRSRDRSTCRSLRREFCNSRRDRRDNSSICRYMGFATSTEGAAGDAPETYADDTELFAEEDADKYDMIIEDIAEELEDGDSEDFGDEDFDGDSEDFGENPEVFDGDSMVSTQ